MSNMALFFIVVGVTACVCGLFRVIDVIESRRNFKTLVEFVKALNDPNFKVL